MGRNQRDRLCVILGDDRGVESDVFHDELRLSAMILEVVARRVVAVVHGPRAFELCCELLSCAMRD